MPKIILTGCTGRIGQEVTKEMEKKGIHCFGISSSKSSENYIKINLNDRKEIYDRLKEHYLDGSVLIMLAAQIHNDPSIIYQNNNMLVNILDHCFRNGCSQVIFTSSTAIYNSNTQEIINENSNLDLRNNYALSKYIGELIVKDFCQKREVPYQILRLSAPFGPLFPTVVRKFINDAINSKPLMVIGKGNRTQSYTCVLNFSKLIIDLIGKEKSGVYNVSSDEWKTTTELAKIVLDLLPDSNSNIQIQEDDTEAELWLKISCKKIKEDFNYNPMTIRQGIDWTIKHLRSEQTAQ